jgi:hypothetical protein
MQKVEQAKTVRLNGVQALKRAFLHRGLIFRSEAAPKVMPQPDQKIKKPKSKPKVIPQPGSSDTKPSEEEPKPNQRKSKSSKDKPKALSEKENKAEESYPERVAEGESDKKIESADDESIDKLKSQTEGSKTAKGPEDLRELTAKSQDVLYEATTVWPFTLFPDTITLDREKLTIANRYFWRTANITSVPVGEIMSAEATVGPFFGSLHLTFRFFANNERTISFLPHRAAIEMQRLIHGYIVAHRREIDVSSVSKDELCKLLKELGQGVTD